MVQTGIGKHLETGADGTTFWIVGTIDKPGNARLDHGSCAHGARFDRYV